MNVSDLSDEQLLSLIGESSKEGQGEVSEEPTSETVKDLSDEELLSFIQENDQQPQKTSVARGLGSAGLEFGTKLLEAGGSALGGFQDEPRPTEDEYDKQFQELVDSGFSEKEAKRTLGPRTTLSIRDLLDKITGESLKPQTTTEQLLTSIGGGAGEFAGMGAVLPGGGGIKKLAKEAKTGALFGAGKGVAKEAGAGEVGQVVAGIAATLTPGGISKAVKAGKRFIKGGKSEIQKAVSAIYTEADELGKDLKVPIGKLEEDLTKINKSLERGIPTPSKRTVKSAVENLLTKIKGKTEVAADEIMELTRNLNEIRGDPAFLKGNKTQLNSLSKSIDFVVDRAEKAGGASGKWGSKFKEANKAFSGIQTNKYLESLINNKVIRNLSPVTLLIFGLPSGGKVAGAVAVAGTVKAGQIANRIINNPGLRKYYLEVARKSAVGNKIGLIKATKAFDKEVQRLGIKEEDLFEE